MQIFQLAPNAHLTIQNEIIPIQLQDIKIGEKKVTEKNLEDLIVEYPHLLNYGDCKIDSHDTAEILILSRQTKTTTNKISDLLGLHIDGSLVVIEVKRDIADEKVRREALEFQAIRYAASSPKAKRPGNRLALRTLSLEVRTSRRQQCIRRRGRSKAQGTCRQEDLRAPFR